MVPKMRPKMAGSPRGRHWRAALTGRGHAASGLKQAQNIQWLYRCWIRIRIEPMGIWNTADFTKIRTQDAMDKIASTDRTARLRKHLQFFNTVFDYLYNNRLPTFFAVTLLGSVSQWAMKNRKPVVWKCRVKRIQTKPLHKEEKITTSVVYRI